MLAEKIDEILDELDRPSRATASASRRHSRRARRQRPARPARRGRVPRRRHEPGLGPGDRAGRHRGVPDRRRRGRDRRCRARRDEPTPRCSSAHPVEHRPGLRRAHPQVVGRRSAPLVPALRHADGRRRARLRAARRSDDRRRDLRDALELDAHRRASATASNATFLAEHRRRRRVVYKPDRRREAAVGLPRRHPRRPRGRRATWSPRRSAGTSCRRTWLRDGPLGPGMVQLWQDVDPEQDAVDLVAADEVPEARAGAPSSRRSTSTTSPSRSIHEDSAALRRMAVFDVVVNNADRKGGHVLAMPDGHRLRRRPRAHLPRRAQAPHGAVGLDRRAARRRRARGRRPRRPSPARRPRRARSPST